MLVVIPVSVVTQTFHLSLSFHMYKFIKISIPVCGRPISDITMFTYTLDTQTMVYSTRKYNYFISLVFKNPNEIMIKSN